MRTLLGAGVLLALAGCGGNADSITIELDEVRDSGITGKVELTPEGEQATRITVIDLKGGEITGARVMPAASCPELDDKYPIKPPSGVVSIEFEWFRRSNEAGPLAASFLRRGRYVACGTT